MALEVLGLSAWVHYGTYENFEKIFFFCVLSIGDAFGSPWGPLGAPWGVLGKPCGVPGGSVGVLGGPSVILGGTLMVPNGEEWPL